MAFTKLNVIQQAFSEIGLGDYVFDAAPEEMQYALRRLDGMMAQWNHKGIRVGYPLPSAYTKSNLSDDVNVSDMALEAMYTGLAVRLAPSMGKQPSPDTKVMARQGYMALLSNSAAPIQRGMDTHTLPAGQGNKQWRWNKDPFLDTAEDAVDAGPDSEMDFY